MPPSFCSFSWGRLLEHSFLEHFCRDQFSVIQGKFYIPRSSTTPFGRTLLGSDFGGLLLEHTLLGTVRPSQFVIRYSGCKALQNYEMPCHVWTVNSKNLG